MLLTKYGFIEIPEDVFKKNIQRLTNQMWKLIPMREHEEDWKKQLETVILEIAGMHEVLMAPQFLQLLNKLEGLRISDINFELYRKTVFECISLLQELSRGIRL